MTTIEKFYPNPLNGRFNLHLYNTTDVQHLNVGLYDLNGRLLYTRSVSHLFRDYNDIPVLIKGTLAKGVYVLKLRANGQLMESQKVINSGQ